MKKLNMGGITIIFSIFLIFSIGSYSILKSDLFNSKKVVIVGNNRITNDDILDKLEIRDDKNIFMYKISDMEEKIIKNPYIESIEIKRKLPDTFNISVKEKEVFGLLKYDDNYCYMDSNGEFIESIKDISEEENSVLVVDIKYDIIKGKLEFIDEESKKKLLYLIECIKDESLNKKIKKIDLTDEYLVKIQTIDDIEILLNKDNLGYDISRISSILVDLQSSNKKGGTLDLSKGTYAIYKS